MTRRDGNPMRLCAVPRLVALALAGVALSGAASKDGVQTFLDRVNQAGRAEATVERVTADPFSGATVTTRGRLALEPPDRAEVRFETTGERITLRNDGGEWHQPALEQMLVLSKAHADEARRWWDLLLGGKGVTLHRLADRRYVAVAREAGSVDSAWVVLGTDRLPSRLEIEEGGEGRTVYRFTGWRFVKPRGRAAFVVKPPAGTRVVPLE